MFVQLVERNVKSFLQWSAGSAWPPATRLRSVSEARVGRLPGSSHTVITVAQASLGAWIRGSTLLRYTGEVVAPPASWAEPPGTRRMKICRSRPPPGGWYLSEVRDHRVASAALMPQTSDRRRYADAQYRNPEPRPRPCPPCDVLVTGRCPDMTAGESPVETRSGSRPGRKVRRSVRQGGHRSLHLIEEAAARAFESSAGR